MCFILTLEYLNQIIDIFDFGSLNVTRSTSGEDAISFDKGGQSDTPEVLAKPPLLKGNHHAIPGEYLLDSFHGDM